MERYQRLQRLAILSRSSGANLASVPISTVTASSVTLDTSYHTVLCDCTSNAITVNLPAASTVPGRLYVIKKIDSTVNAVTVDPNSAELIDADSTVVIQSQWNAITIQSNGTGWYRL